jgi:IMP dehydrogenase
MRFQHPEHDERLELSLEDVFLLPGRWDGSSRLDVDLRPTDFPGGSNPIVSSNMNAVTGKRMAETMARFGGLGVLPQDMDLRTVERIVKHIKSADARLDTPLTVRRDATLRDVLGLIRKRSHDVVVVVDERGVPEGVITHADLRERDQYTPAEHLMSRDVVTLAQTASNEEAFDLMGRERLSAVPVVDGDGRLRGVLTRDDTVRLEIIKPSLNASGELMVAAAIGIGDDAGRRAAALRELGVDVIVLDTAHGHQRRMLEAVRAVRATVGLDAPLVAGNVCTAEGTTALIDAGADIVKVNVGPGAMCTTRMQTGVGRPTFSSVRACASAAREQGKHVWADGGVRHPRDVALYLAAGAARVMVGTILAGTYESPGDIKEDREGRSYKENYGMASARAVADRVSGLHPFERAKRGFFEEGISTSRVYLRRGRESVGSILTEMLTGLQSAFTYVGATSCEAFFERSVVGVQTSGGYSEGKPRGEVGGVGFGS